MEGLTLQVYLNKGKLHLVLPIQIGLSFLSSG